MSLFPNINNFLKPEVCSLINENSLYQNKNVGSFDYFDYYFVYDLSENIVSNANFTIMLNNIYDYNLFTANLKEIFVMNDDKLINYISSDILSKLEIEIGHAVKNLNDKIKNEEFVKNIVWLYSYSNKDNKVKKSVINIFLKFFKGDNITELLNIFKKIIYKRILQTLFIH